MITIAIMDVLITLLTAVYARFICVPSTVELFLPPNNTVYVNSSQRLQTYFSSASYELFLTSEPPKLSKQFSQFSTNRMLVLGTEANFGIFYGLHDLRFNSTENAILRISLENNYLDNIFSRREVLLIIKANASAAYNFTTQAGELVVLKVSIISPKEILHVRNFYYYCTNGSFCSYYQFKEEVKDFRAKNQTDIFLFDSFMNYDADQPKRDTESSSFKSAALLVNGDEFNSVVLETSSPSKYQINGLYDFLAVLGGFYAVTLFLFVLKRYGILYEEYY